MPKISEFPNTTTLADTDELVVASGGTNKQIQYGQLHDQLGVAFTDTSGALSVESAVADGASAVAYTFISSEVLSTSGARLIDCQVATGGGFSVYGSGGIGFNATWVNYWWGPPLSGEVVSIVNGDSLPTNYPKFHAEYFTEGVGAVDNSATVTATDAGAYVTVTNSSAGTQSQLSSEGLFLWDSDNNTLQQVTYGANDSGGSGKRALVIPNAP